MKAGMTPGAIAHAAALLCAARVGRRRFDRLNGVILIECHCKTAALTAPRTLLYCLPLEVAEADGARARAGGR